MDKVGMLALLLMHFITSALLINISQITVYPKHGSIAGVFHASLLGNYAFDASVARQVCEQLGVTIADKAQVQHASTRGFETCRFGWIDEQIAVIPRIQPNQACGQGRVGIIPWRATLNKMFDVFCFNITDFDAQAQRTTPPVHKTTAGTPKPHKSQSSAGGVHLQKVKSSHSASATPWSDLHSTFSEMTPYLNYQEDKEEAQALGSTRGVVPTALLISTFFTFLLAAIVAVWYFKTRRSCMGLWNEAQQKEYIETEVWDRGDIKGVKEARVEVKNHSLENTNDISVAMNCVHDNESKNEAAS